MNLLNGRIQYCKMDELVIFKQMLQVLHSNFNNWKKKHITNNKYIKIK